MPGKKLHIKLLHLLIMGRMWRLVDLEFTDPYLNIAVEEAIMQSVGRGDAPSTLRFWRNFNTIVIGRNQCPSYELNLRNCLRHRVNVVRRFTGGGTVYQDLGNLNYALSVRRSPSIMKNSIYEGYRLVGRSVADGLKKLGLNAYFQPMNSIETDGRKISGMAGLWGKTCFVHGSLLVSTRLKVLYNVLNPTLKSSRANKVRSVKKKVTTINKELPMPVDISTVKDTLKKVLEKTFEVEIKVGSLTEKEKSLAKYLSSNKYSKMKWNLEPCRECPNRPEDEQIFKLLTYKYMHSTGSSS